jgi:hypothetical protein
MVGLHLIKHMDGLSDAAVCARFLDSPYVQLFCGETHVQHALSRDRSSMTRWRQRIGAERLELLLAETLAAAQRAGAAGDAITLILAGAGHNLRLLRAWLARLLEFLLSLLAISATAPPLPSPQLARLWNHLFHGRLCSPAGSERPRMTDQPSGGAPRERRASAASGSWPSAFANPWPPRARRRPSSAAPWRRRTIA